MLKALSKNEFFVGLNEVAKNAQIHDYKLQYHARRNQFRVFKFKGCRVIEIKCAISLLAYFRDVKNVTTANNEIARLTQMSQDWENLITNSSGTSSQL